MRKEKINTDLTKNEKKFKKAIIKRINESVHTKNFKKIETNRNRKINLYLNNDSNPNYARTEHYVELTSQNIYSNKIQGEKSNNIFLENNSILLNSKKTRNKIINFRQINEQNSLNKKTVGVFNFKNIFSTKLNNKGNKNKSKKELMNMSHQSCDEEMGRKFYLNGNYKKIYLKRLNKFLPKNNSQIYEKNSLKYNNSIYCSSKNNSNNDSRQYFQNYNNGYLTTKEKTNCENTYSNNNNSNTINTTKNNDTPIITNFSCRNNKYTYKKVLYSIDFSKILYIEKEQDNKRCIIKTEEKEYNIQGNLNQIEKLLDKRFLKCSRSYIINIEQVESYNAKKNLITFQNGIELYAISRNKKKEFLNTFRKI